MNGGLIAGAGFAIAGLILLAIGLSGTLSLIQIVIGCISICIGPQLLSRLRREGDVVKALSNTVDPLPNGWNRVRLGDVLNLYTVIPCLSDSDLQAQCQS